MLKKDLGRIVAYSKGEYSSATSYERLDIVEYQGSGYMCVLACKGVSPFDTSHWKKMVSKGETGATGPQGNSGATNASGIHSINSIDANTTIPNDTASLIQVAGAQAVKALAKDVERLNEEKVNISGVIDLSLLEYQWKKAVWEDTLGVIQSTSNTRSIVSTFISCYKYIKIKLKNCSVSGYIFGARVHWYSYNTDNSYISSTGFVAGEQTLSVPYNAKFFRVGVCKALGSTISSTNISQELTEEEGTIITNVFSEISTCNFLENLESTCKDKLNISTINVSSLTPKWKTFANQANNGKAITSDANTARLYVMDFIPAQKFIKVKLANIAVGWYNIRINCYSDDNEGSYLRDLEWQSKEASFNLSDDVKYIRIGLGKVKSVSEDAAFTEDEYTDLTKVINSIETVDADYLYSARNKSAICHFDGSQNRGTTVNASVVNIDTENQKLYFPTAAFIQYNGENSIYLVEQIGKPTCVYTSSDVVDNHICIDIPAIMNNPVVIFNVSNCKFTIANSGYKCSADEFFLFRINRKLGTCSLPPHYYSINGILANDEGGEFTLKNKGLSGVYKTKLQTANNGDALTVTTGFGIIKGRVYKIYIKAASAIKTGNDAQSWFGIGYNGLLAYTDDEIVNGKTWYFRANTSAYTSRLYFYGNTSCAANVECTWSIKDVTEDYLCEKTYEYDGEPITFKKKSPMTVKYFGSEYQEGIYVSGVYHSAQGLAIHENYMFRMYNGGYCRIFDISDYDNVVLLDEIKLANDSHCNAAQFSNEYKDGGIFPLLYIAGYDSENNCRCYVENIRLKTTNDNGYSSKGIYAAEKVQTITMVNHDNLVYYDIISGDDGYLYAGGVTYSSNGQSYFNFYKFNRPKISEGDVYISGNENQSYDYTGKTLAQKPYPILKSANDTSYDNTNETGQGCGIHEGKLFFVSGDIGKRRVIRGYDTATGVLVNTIPMDNVTHLELEDVALAGSSLIVAITGGYGYYRLTFK